MAAVRPITLRTLVPNWSPNGHNYTDFTRTSLSHSAPTIGRGGIPLGFDKPLDGVETAAACVAVSFATRSAFHRGLVQSPPIVSEL